VFFKQIISSSDKFSNWEIEILFNLVARESSDFRNRLIDNGDVSEHAHFLRIWVFFIVSDESCSRNALAPHNMVQHRKLRPCLSIFLRIAIACWRFPYFFSLCTQRIVTPRKRRNVTDKISNFIFWNRRRNWIIANIAEFKE